MNSDVILQRKRQIGSKWRVLRLIVNQLLFRSKRKFFERGPVSKTAGIKLVLSGQDRPHFIEAGREFHVAPILQHASSAGWYPYKAGPWISRSSMRAPNRMFVSRNRIFSRGLRR